MAVPDTQLADWQAADFYADGKLDVFDLCLMRRELLYGSKDQTPQEEQDTAAYSIIFENGGVTLKDSDSKIVSDCDSITVSCETVTITKPGEYSVSGKSANGQLIVDIDKAVYLHCKKRYSDYRMSLPQMKRRLLRIILLQKSA